MVLSPFLGTSYFPNSSNFTITIHSLPLSRARFGLFCFLSSVPTPSLATVPTSWATLKLPAPQTEVLFFLSFFFFFLLKARLSYHWNHSQMTPSCLGLMDTGMFPMIIRGIRVKWHSSSENAHIHTGSGAHTTGHGCVFTDLSALLPE